jgi:CelD/BcsL family acetyltransferase involved in cellulose biosynthesis
LKSISLKVLAIHLEGRVLVNVNQRLDEILERSSLRVVEMDPQRDSRWLAFMQTMQTSVIYQHPAWLGTLEEAYGYKPLHLGCEDASGALHGILPLFYRRGLRSGRLCTSLFDSPLAGPLASDDQARKLLIQKAIECTRAEGGTQFQFKAMSTNFDALVENVTGVPLFETYELTLPEQPDSVRLDPKIRWAINKATKLGMQVRLAETMGDLRAWYELYLQTMRRLVAVPKPYHFFEQAWRRLHPQGLLRLLLAEHVQAEQTRLISGFLFLQWGQTVSHIFTGWRREDQQLRPNDLLHWHAIGAAIAQGMRWYDFGNVRVGDQGLVHFKSKWGAEAKAIYRYSYPTAPLVSQKTVRTSVQSKGSRLRHLGTPLWQHLPTNVIGLTGNLCYVIHYY